MSHSVMSDADGRLHRARQPIRKLHALGLEIEEVIDLYRRYARRREETEIEPDHEDGGGPREERHRVAQELIRTLIALGFCESDIASMADVHPSTIAHVLGFEGYVPSSDVIRRLQTAMQGAAAERLRMLLPRINVTVLETCCDKGRRVNLTSGPDRAALEDGVREVLRSLLLRSALPTRMAPGVTGVLARVGDSRAGVTLIAAPFGDADTDDMHLARLKGLEHEAEHLLQQYREERQQLEQKLGLVESAVVPKDSLLA
jgi:hypothetical protein